MKNKLGVRIYDNTIIVNGKYWSENSIIFFGGDNSRVINNRIFCFYLRKKRINE